MVVKPAPKFEHIEASRCAAGISVNAIAQASGVAASLYWRARKGQPKRERTLARWSHALHALRIQRRARAQREPISEDVIRACYRGWVVYFAGQENIDPALALASDPSQRRTSDEAWMAAAGVRAFAVYCAVIELNLRGGLVASSVGLSKQGVSAILRRVEDLREDPLVDARLEAAGLLISGRN